MTVVSGTLVVPPGTPRAIAALILVEVRDVTFADAPSQVAGQQVRTGVAIRPNGQIPFRVEVPAFDERHIYTLRAHVSLDGEQTQAKPGDLLTARNHPVLTRGAPTEGLIVQLSRI